MTQDELNALTQLLQRTLLSNPEALWVNSFVSGKQAEIDAAKQKAAKPTTSSSQTFSSITDASQSS